MKTKPFVLSLMLVVVTASWSWSWSGAAPAPAPAPAPATVSGPSAGANTDADCRNIEAVRALDARGGYIRREGASLFLTSDLKKNPEPGCRLDLTSDPRSPAVVCDSLPGAWDIAVAGEHAVVCDYTKFLTVYDMRGREWRQTAKVALPSMSENVVIRGDLACVANHVGGLTIVDISTPSKPSVVSNFNPEIDCDAVGLWQDCAILYGHWESRLVLVDISDPAKPRQTGVYQNPPKTFNQGELAVANGLAFCTTLSGIVIVDVADRQNPKLVKAVDLGSRVTDVVVEDGHAFLAAGPQGVRVLDVSDPGAPAEIGHYKAPKKFAASQLAVQRVAPEQDADAGAADSGKSWLIYAANAKGPAMVLEFCAP